MKGVARAAARRTDENTIQVYQALSFYCLAQKGKLKAVKHYLIDKPKKRKMSPEEMFGILQQFQAGGAPLNIREVN
jgi:hypothetical protein